MSAAVLLSRLDRVTDCGEGRWRAVCPGHESKNKSQSLAIREAQDGVILIHCFAGCCAGDVVAAIGLSLSDLYPEGARTHRARRGRPNHCHAAAQALQTLHREVVIALLALEHVRRGGRLDEADTERAVQACVRIRRAAEACR